MLRKDTERHGRNPACWPVNFSCKRFRNGISRAFPKKKGEKACIPLIIEKQWFSFKKKKQWFDSDEHISSLSIRVYGLLPDKNLAAGQLAV
jgi:hypothetical protein